LDGVKGLYHINAVDEVTQWQVVGATAQISEAWLMAVLEGMLPQFLSFKLSLRDLVIMMADRGISVTHTTILRWI
jgi:hypothetical protein